MKLSKGLFFALMGLCISLGAAAQNKNSGTLLNIGLGLNSQYSGGVPVSGIIEFSVAKDITVGGGVDYLSYHYNYGYNRYSFSATYIGARGSYHFNEALKIKNNKFDVYGGLSLGYRTFSWSDNYNGYYGIGSTYGSGLYLGIHAGGRYYFNNRVATFLELGGLGSSNARVGVTFKF